MDSIANLIKPLLFSIVLTLFISPFILPVLKRLKVGQSIREEGPKSHQSKSGTPTMGGILFIVASLLATLIFAPIDKNVVLMILSVFGFAGLGFADDYLKVVKKKNEGLLPYQKFIIQFLLAIGIAYFSHKGLGISEIYIPFSKVYLSLHWSLYISIIVFIILGTNNGANLTDGLDGLATGVTIPILIFFAIAAETAGIRGIAVFNVCVVGALIAFLVFNSNPAGVFMGDVGSLALGGIVAVNAVVLKLGFLIPIVAFIYFIETLSVIIQVISFKTTGKRVFRMSPIHHHFEELGGKETKIVTLFWIVSWVMSFVAMLAITNYRF